MHKFITTTLGKPVPKECMRVNIGPRRGSISGTFNLVQYKDKDTKQIVIYIPTLELSGYGETVDKAKEMLDFVVREYFQYLRSLGPNNIQNELFILGFRRGIFKKQYSKAYIDEDGKLQNLNAENDEIKRLLLTAA